MCNLTTRISEVLTKKIRARRVMSKTRNAQAMNAMKIPQKLANCLDAPGLSFEENKGKPVFGGTKGWESEGLSILLLTDNVDALNV